MKETFNRVIKSGWIHFRRNSYLSFGTTGVMAITLFLFVGLISLNILTSQIVVSLQEKIDISAYFTLNAEESQILSIKSDLESLPEVKNVEYISRDQALDIFKERHKDDTLIQESLMELDENPLQASLNIKAQDSSGYASIVGFIENNKLAQTVDKVNFYENESAINRITSISRGMQTWGLFITLVLAAIAVLITFNSIRLTIYSQKQEIEIMRLVGASNWQIRNPFLVEGVLYGLFAAIITLGVVYPGLYAVSDKITAFAPSINLFDYFVSFAYQIVPMVVFLGVAIGILSSIIAIRKHLKI